MAAAPDAGGMPSAIGRLVAIVITCGLGWALLVAISIWVVVFVVGRIAG